MNPRAHPSDRLQSKIAEKKSRLMYRIYMNLHHGKSVRAVLSYRYLFTCWQPDEIYQTSESVVSMLTGLTRESHSSTPSASPTAEAGTPLHHQQIRCTLRTKLAASAGQDHQWIYTAIAYFIQFCSAINHFECINQVV